MAAPEQEHFVFVLGHDRALLRYGLSLILSKAFPNTVIREADDSDTLHQAMTMIPTPAILLLGINTDVEGIVAIADLSCLSKTYPNIPILALADTEDMYLARQAMCQGAHGCLPKTTLGGTRSLVAAIHSVLSGSIYLPLDTIRALLRSADELTVASGIGSGLPNDRARSAEMVRKEDVARLTQRQREVLNLLTLGRSNHQIANELDLARATVKMHISSILRMLNVSDRGMAAEAALRLRRNRQD